MSSATVRTVLVLHGYSQNSSIFSKRLGALRKECGKEFDLVFVDAPHVLQPVDLVGLSSPSTLNASEASSASVDPTLTPRGWWKTNKERTKMTGLEETLVLMRDMLKERRFHGVFGFSQGAALAGLLSALLERPHTYPPFLVDGQPPHPPFEFCVAVSGFRVNDPAYLPFYEPSYSTPTLHVIGKTDIVVLEERSKQLIDVSNNKRVEDHDGGHFVPSQGNWRRFFRNYMRDPTSPELISLRSMGSVPNSGTATPVRADETSVQPQLQTMRL
ncbi:FSH1-domain-containing protein [Pluteus cervinus]|uniref:FSH1-domain-containing protein n=1 Tax=Pluteus cervinus TaxID=181527 RepID=A0ACD3AJ02_9AGAR|nr:FSH1-domain-containing protein [Pluteus cervinus]